MEQVAHQTIAMQFILELAKSLKVDPRACFRQFFTKIKVGRWSSSGDPACATGGGRHGSTVTQASVIRISIHQQRISPWRSWVVGGSSGDLES